MRRFVLRDVGLVLERESDIVKSFEQAMARECVDLEVDFQTLLVLDQAVLEIDHQAVIGGFRSSPRDLSGFFLLQAYCEHAILLAFFREDVGQPRTNHGPYTKLRWHSE